MDGGRDGWMERRTGVGQTDTKDIIMLEIYTSGIELMTCVGFQFLQMI